MPAVLPIPFAIPKKRLALARMYVDLTSAFHVSIYPPDQTPVEIDANLVLVAVAVMLGHAEGHPMTSSEIASCVQMPRSSVARRLGALIAHGRIRRIDNKYYLEPKHAALVLPRYRPPIALT